MSRFLPESKTSRFIGLGIEGAAFQHAALPGNWVQQAFPPRGAATEIGSQAFTTNVKISANASAPCWVVSSALMPTWLQVPIPGLRSLRELQSLAQMRAKQLLGDQVSLGGWAVAGDWQARQPFLCTALPVAWKCALSDSSEIATPLTMGMYALRNALPASGWLSITCPAELHLMYLERKAVQHLRSFRLPTGLTDTGLQERMLAEWQREMIKSQRPEARLHWLHLGPGRSSLAHSALRWADEQLTRRLIAVPPPADHKGWSEPQFLAWAGLNLRRAIEP